MDTLCRSFCWARVIGLGILFVAGGLQAETEAETQQKQAELQKEFEDGIAVVVQLYPSAAENGSPMNKAMSAVDHELKAANSPVYDSGQKAIIVARLAARRAGVSATEKAALTAQAFTDVESRHVDLYGMTSWFSQDFWRMAPFVRALEPEAVFRDMPDGDAIARSIRTLHPRYAEQWPLVCMAFVESHITSLQAKLVTQKMQAIVLPKLTVSGASVEELVEYMRLRSKDLDPQHEGVNIILKARSPVSAQISLDLREVPFENALRYIAELAGMQLKLEGDSALIVPLADGATTPLPSQYHPAEEGYRPIGSGYVPIGGPSGPKKK